MATETEIANLALVLLGAGRITSFADESEEARNVNAVFGMLRDAELRGNIWQFATKRVALPALSSAPAFGFGYAYQVPADFLRLVEVGEWYAAMPSGATYIGTDTSPYRLEGNRILTNEGAPLKVRYVYRVTDTQSFDPLFNMALAAKIADVLSTKIPNFSEGKKQLIAAQYADAIKLANRTNAVEQPPVAMPHDTWVTARIGA